MTVNAAAPAGSCLRWFGHWHRPGRPRADQLHDAPARPAALPEPEGAGGPGTSTAVLGDGVPWPESYCRTSGSPSTPAARAMARMCPRAKKSPPQAVKSSSSIPPDGRLPNAAARLRRGCGYRLILPRFPHRERSPGSGIRLPAGENRGGLPACPLPRVRGHEDTATMAPLRCRRRGASPAAPREPGHVHGLRAVVIGLGGDASRQAPATGARRLVPYRSAAVSRRRREGGPGCRRWRVPGWRVLVAGGAPGSGSGCGGRLFCVTA
jgi:hypothetical protein